MKPNGESTTVVGKRKTRNAREKGTFREDLWQREKRGPKVYDADEAPF